MSTKFIIKCIFLGLAPSDEDPEMAKDGKPFTTLLYGTGPGWQGLREIRTRDNLTDRDTC